MALSDIKFPLLSKTILAQLPIFFALLASALEQMSVITWGGVLLSALTIVFRMLAQSRLSFTEPPRMKSLVK